MCRLSTTRAVAFAVLLLPLQLTVASAVRAQGHGILPRAVEIGDLPPGFAERIVARGIDGATGMAIAPDGRVFVCEQTGALRVVKNDALLEEPFVRLEVDSYWERGLIGIALDPLFERNGHVYLHYTALKPWTHFRVSRFTAAGDRAVPGSEKVLIEGDDQSTLGGKVPAGHQGGGMAFGNDGKLYVVIGEMTTSTPSQRLDTFLGKILRLHPNGAIPIDNPFYSETEGKYRAIWALGLRNPFAVSVQRATGRIFVNDVGQSLWEEINEIRPGANYGWPLDEGPTDNPAHTGPVHAYVHHARGSISGGTFYEPTTRQFPEKYEGTYFFAEYEDHWIKVLDPDRPEDVWTFATGLAGPVAIAASPDGSLYYLNRNTWIKDKRYQAGRSSLHKVMYVPDSTSGAPRVTRSPSDTTAATGSSVVFEVSATADRSPLVYQWLKNGKRIPGAASRVYGLGDVKAADNGATFQCIVSNGSGAAKSRAARLWVTPLREPAREPALARGLDLRLYEGEFQAVPDFDSLQPTVVRSTRGIELDASELPGAPFGLRLEGFVNVPEDGVYAFEVASSGLSKLFIASQEIATTSSSPDDASTDPAAASGSVGLEAGVHSLLLVSIHGTGAPRLDVRIAGPTGPPRTLLESELFRRGPGSPAAPRDTVRELVTTLNVPPEPRRIPRLLSRTGIFRSLADLSPGRGIVEYDVRLPQWADGARTRRWIALPGDSTIEFSGSRPWGFPPGTVFVQHFEIQIADESGGELPGRDDTSEALTWRRLETRVLRVDRYGLGYGVTYRWRTDGSDAELLTEGAEEELTIRGSGSAPARDVTWTYPRSTECLSCHNSAAGFVLGATTRQLDRPRDDGSGAVIDQSGAHQIEAWSRAGLFSRRLSGADLEGAPRLARIDDTSSPLEHRARSYLDVNCAHCHRPGGPRGKLDARFDAPDGLRPVIGARPGTTGFDIAGAKIIAPGDPYRSTLYYRVSKLGLGGMPPLGSGRVDERALELMREWILSLRPENAAAIARRQRDVLEAFEAAIADSTRIGPLLASTGDALALADMVQRQRVSQRVRARLVETAGVHDDPRIRGLFERFLPREQRIQRIGPVLDAPRVLALTGDSERGRRLFVEAAGLRCATCHAVDSTERKVGPDLGQIAAKYTSPEKLLESLASPSKDIDPKYRTRIVLTADGRALTGVITEESEERIVVVDMAGKERRLVPGEVIDVLEQPQSLMPEGLLKDLTHQQAADLVAFLMKR